ncbi:MAG: hypothetical protein IPN19_08620 [Elusimicrobia bacterium]|nr:hypothetical protein [Elusimicrobiota bacterium]
MMKQLHINFDHMWSVFKDESQGKYWIEVECGGSGLYPVRIPLTPEEVQMFEKDKNSLDNLAAKIAYSPETYKRERGSL